MIIILDDEVEFEVSAHASKRVQNLLGLPENSCEDIVNHIYTDRDLSVFEIIGILMEYSYEVSESEIDDVFIWFKSIKIHL